MSILSRIQTTIRVGIQRGFRAGIGALALGCAMAGLFPPAAQARPIDFEGLQIDVRGPADGRPVLMIPGLNSAAAVWDQTCAALIEQSQVQCHIVNLPGFAGVPAMADDQPFLDHQAKRLLRYVEQEQLKRPVLMGHSLGGVVGLLVARAEPKALSQLVIVDSLPFFPAAMNPAATAEMVNPMAEGMREGMQAATPEAYGKQLEAALRGMSNQPERLETLKGWGHASDRATTTQAMYEMFSRDLRADLAEVRTPTLVLGSWAAYKPMGSTEESTRKIFTDQYAKLEGVDVRMAPTGYHFLMWDDQEWLLEQVKSVL